MSGARRGRERRTSYHWTRSPSPLTSEGDRRQTSGSAWWAWGWSYVFRTRVPPVTAPAPEEVCAGVAECLPELVEKATKLGRFGASQIWIILTDPTVWSTQISDKLKDLLESLREVEHVAIGIILWLGVVNGGIAVGFRLRQLPRDGVDWGKKGASIPVIRLLQVGYDWLAQAAPKRRGDKMDALVAAVHGLAARLEATEPRFAAAAAATAQASQDRRRPFCRCSAPQDHPSEY